MEPGEVLKLAVPHDEEMCELTRYFDVGQIKVPKERRAF